MCQVVPKLDGHFETKIIPEAHRLVGLECDVEVEGRPPIATHICCSLLKQCRGCNIALKSLSSAALHIIVCQVVPTLDGCDIEAKIIPEAHQFVGLECDVEVEGRPAIATHS